MEIQQKLQQITHLQVLEFDLHKRDISVFFNMGVIVKIVVIVTVGPDERNRGEHPGLVIVANCKPDKHGSDKLL